MKKSLIIVLFLISSIAISQNKLTMKDEIIKIMYKELNYTYDSTSNKPKVNKTDSIEKKILLVSYSSLPENPSPLVILNGKPINIEDIKQYESKDINNVEIISPDDPKAGAIYGSRGAVKGVILLSTKS